MAIHPNCILLSRTVTFSLVTSFFPIFLTLGGTKVNCVNPLYFKRRQTAEWYNQIWFVQERMDWVAAQSLSLTRMKVEQRQVFHLSYKKKQKYKIKKGKHIIESCDSYGDEKSHWFINVPEVHTTQSQLQFITWKQISSFPNCIEFPISNTRKIKIYRHWNTIKKITL